MSKKVIVAKTADLVEPMADSLGLEVVDIDFVKEGPRNVLRVLIDREGGITIDDCERLSKMLDIELDTKDFISQSYFLEVSSPGIERPLKKEDDYMRFTGRKAAVKTFAAVEGRKLFSGVIRGMENGNVLLEDEVRIWHLPLTGIAKANLVFEE